jgi:hypothetical protein
VTFPRTEMFMHTGGPCDGTEMPVEVDDAGVPVEINMVSDFTAPNEAVPGYAAHQAKGLRSMYEREEVFGDNGFAYVFRYRGTDTIDYNQRHRAA